MLARYISAHGGVGAMIGGSYGRSSGGRSGGSGEGGAGGGGGGGRPRRIGGAATRVGQRLGGFTARVNQTGLATALREVDLGSLVGRPANEVLPALLERLAGPGTTMDANLARIALNRVRQELLGAAHTFEEVERALTSAVQQIQVAGIVMQFYGHFLYERFLRDFYERLVQKVGTDKARRSMDSIKRTIFASLRAKVGRRDPTRMDWRGAAGRRLAERVLAETLEIFAMGA